MGALDDDTEVEPVAGVPGRYRGRLRRDWETWGPNGGYLASVALRAAGTATTLPLPATFSCLFLRAGTFDDVEIEVTSLRSAKRTEALRVTITQDERALLEAHVWTVEAELPGLEHSLAVAPDVAGPDELRSIAELEPDAAPHRFWQNFDRKPISWTAPGDAPPPSTNSAIRQWMRFTPEARWQDDPWVNACRSVVLLDTFQWPAAHQPHSDRRSDQPAFIAPNIDLSIRFHRAVPSSEWLVPRPPTRCLRDQPPALPRSTARHPR